MSKTAFVWTAFTVGIGVCFGFDAYWIATSTLKGAHQQWLVTLALVIALCLLAGYMVNGRLDGILINDRNRISLGRLQWTAWLIVLMSGYFVEALWNAGHGGEIPTMQQDLLGLLGIVSGTSVVGGVISNSKKQTEAPASPGKSIAKAQPGDSPADVGQLDANKTPKEASWADLYLGEDVANRYVVDLSRLQKLLFTIILIAIYAAWLWQALGDPPKGIFAEMPKLDDKGTFLWLLGISNGTYLASKATPKTTN